MEVKKHYKLYKAGKQWIIGAVTVLGLFGMMGIASAHADTVTNQTDTAPQTASSSSSVASSAATSSSESQSSSASSANSSAATSQSSNGTSSSDSVAASSASSATNSSATPSSNVSTNSAASSAISTSSVATSNNSETTSQATSSESAASSATSSTSASASSANSIVKSGVFGTSAWDIDSQGDLNIHAGVLGSSTDTGKWDGLTSNKITTINIDQGVVANADSSNLFYDNSSSTSKTVSTLTQINGLENLDTSNVVNMSYFFANLNSIAELDLTKLNTSKVTNMQYMFAGDSDLSTADVTNFNTENVTNMLGMFMLDSQLKEINVKNWNVSKVQNMGLLFAGTSVSNLDISNWDTSSVTNLAYTFANTPNLKNVEISNWKLPNLTSFVAMFQQSGAIFLDLSVFNDTSIHNSSGYNYDGIGDYFSNNIPNLTAVKLGPSVILSASDDSNGYSVNQPVLINGVGTGYAYGSEDGVHLFQAVGNGTIDNPQGALYTATEIDNLYQSAGGPTETYVLLTHKMASSTVTNIFTADDSSITSTSDLTSDNSNINVVGNINTVSGILGVDKLQALVPPLSFNNGEYVLDTNFNNSFITLTFSSGETQSETIQQIINAFNQPTEPDSYTELSSVIGALNNNLFDSASLTSGSFALSFTFNYIHQAAAPITVNYVDDQGKVLATDTATYPNGQFINEGYTTSQKSIDGYTFKQLSSDSLAANGVLNSTGGTVTYVYTQDVSQPITLNIIDTDTGQILNSTDFIGGLTDALAIQDSDYIPAQYHLATGDELNGQTQLQDGNYAWTTVPQTLNIYVSGDKSTVTQTRNVTRTIQFITPSNTLSIGNIVETVQLSRDVTTDLATGTIINTTDWAAVGSDIWPGITIPTIDGYHATITVLPDQTVTGTTANSIVQVKYVEN